MTASPQKSYVTLFTPDKRHESKRKIIVELNNTKYPQTKKVTILGLRLDTQMTYNSHISDITSKATHTN